MKIGEIARRAGVRTSAIRFYESAGLLPSPRRTGGRRDYDPDVLARLAVIQFAQSAAFKLKEIRELFSIRAGELPISARWKRLASAKMIELDAVIARAEAMKRELQQALHCGCVEVEQCGRALLRERPGLAGSYATGLRATTTLDTNAGRSSTTSRPASRARRARSSFT
jgi:MerR family transcriptional regulator, redox-sensitive transcriptional activator SoxR